MRPSFGDSAHRDRVAMAIFGARRRTLCGSRQDRQLLLLCCSSVRESQAKSRSVRLTVRRDQWKFPTRLLFNSRTDGVDALPECRMANNIQGEIAATFRLDLPLAAVPSAELRFAVALSILPSMEFFGTLISIRKKRTVSTQFVRAETKVRTRISKLRSEPSESIPALYLDHFLYTSLARHRKSPVFTRVSARSEQW